MTPLPTDSRSATGGPSLRTLTIAAGIAAAAHLAVLIVRLINLAQKGDLFEATGGEVAPIYTVWKACHGLPVYEDPFAGRFTTALYNWAFYGLYGSVARMAGWDGSTLVHGARLLTAALGMLGVLVFVVDAARLARVPLNRRRAMGGLVAFGFVTWYSSSAWSWFALSVRADMASMICVMCGLGAYVNGLSRRSITWPVVSGLAFLAAWSFKQSTIGILGGVLLHAVIHRRAIAQAALISVPVAAGVLLSLWLGGPLYRLNVVTLPAAARFGYLAESWPRMVKVLITHPYVVLAPLGWVMIGARMRMGLGEESSTRLTALTWAAAGSFCWSVFALNRSGADANTMLEFFLSGSLLAIGLLGRLSGFESHGRWRLFRRALLVSVAAAALFPLAQLLAWNRLGNLTVTPAREYEALGAARDVVSRLPKPVFVEAGMLALPWYSNNNRFPAFVIDNYLYFNARSAGRLAPGHGLDVLVGGRTYPSLLLRFGDLDPAAIGAGYQRQALPGQAADAGFRLFVLSQPRDDDAR